MDNFYTINEVIEKYNNGCTSKAKMSTSKMLIKAVLAGMMIAFGAAGSSVAAHAIDNVGIARLITAVVFPVGLMMVIMLGAELFTGACLLSMGSASKKVPVMDVIRMLTTIYIGNFIGSVIIAIAIFMSGQLNYSNGLLGAYTIKIAMAKINISPTNAVVSGILCNILVCAAVLMALAAKDIAGKLLATFFTIMLFAVAGFEHCVANMYYIAAGMFARLNTTYAEQAIQKFGYSAEQLSNLDNTHFMINNLLPVTIGNIIGGVAIGLVLYYVNRKEVSKNRALEEEKKNEHDTIFRGNSAGARC